MVFNATFNNISVIALRSVLLVEETGVPGENYRPDASHCQTLSHNIVSSTPRLGFEFITLVVIGTDYIGSCKSSYHTIMTSTAPCGSDGWPCHSTKSSEPQKCYFKSDVMFK